MKYLAVAVIFYLTCFTASADTWDSPKVTDYNSSDSAYYVRVVPYSKPKKYNKWRTASVKRKTRFSPQDTIIIHAHAMMYKRTNFGDSLVWKEKLINRIAPVIALVSQDGQYFATFDIGIQLVMEWTYWWSVMKKEDLLSDTC